MRKAYKILAGKFEGNRPNGKNVNMYHNKNKSI